MDWALITAVIIAVSCIILTIFMFWYYGAFYLPWYIPGICLITLWVAVIQVFGLLPFDASWHLFGSDPNSMSEKYKKMMLKIYDILYWVSFVLGWIVTPTVTSFYTYNYGLTWGAKIWYAVRYNILWYCWVIFGIAIGVGILIATNNLQISNILPLVMALSTAYGIVLLCLLLGHGFIAIPIKLWQYADLIVKKRVHLFNISMVSKPAAQAIFDAKNIIEILENAPSKGIKQYSKIFEDNLRPRLEIMRYYLNLNLLPDPRHYLGLSLSKDAKKIKETQFNIAFKRDLEQVLRSTDEIVKNLTSRCIELYTEARDAHICHNKLNSNFRHKSRIFFHRLLAIFIGLVNLTFLWGELTIMFKTKLSPFYQLSRIHMPKALSEVCVTFPIILYLVSVGTWSLTKVKFGSFFKFIPHGTGDLTFYFFVVILGRLAPTIGYHYLMQVGGEQSITYQYMDVIKKIPIIGRYWKYAAPVLMILVSAVVAFRVWDRLMHSLGVKRFTFDNDLSLFNDTTVNDGQSILDSMNVNFDYNLTVSKREKSNNSLAMEALLEDTRYNPYGW